MHERHEPEVERLNEGSDDGEVVRLHALHDRFVEFATETAQRPVPKPLDPDRFRWRRVRYSPHQGSRERTRRLAQVALQRLSGPVVSREAEVAGEQIRCHVSWVRAVEQATEATHVYLNDALHDGSEEAIARRDRLFCAVYDLWAWVAAGRPRDTTRAIPSTLAS